MVSANSCACTPVIRCFPNAVRAVLPISMESGDTGCPAIVVREERYTRYGNMEKDLDSSTYPAQKWPGSSVCAS